MNPDDALERLAEMQPAGQPGILVRPDREPVTPTIVFAPDCKTFEGFCCACRMNANSVNLKFAGQRENSPFKRGDGSRGISPGISPEDRRWKHVAFLLANPVGYYNSYPRSAWYDLECMRRNNQLTRAFYYPELRYVVPNVTDEGR